jgi:hypothetical protein
MATQTTTVFKIGKNQRATICVLLLFFAKSIVKTVKNRLVFLYTFPKNATNYTKTCKKP